MLEEKVNQTIAEYEMIKKGDTVCAALSGGADSVAVLILLLELGYSPSAVHVNHLLRGGESDRDEAFCRELCARLGVPLTVYRQDAAAFARSLGVSVETGAREMRYRLFESLPAQRIALAHNQGDNAETVLFRMARGTGLRGLCGIPPVRGRFIRPLLYCSRAEIEDFLTARGQDYVTDSTNLSDEYARNRIRHKVMPELSEVHGGFPECVNAMTRSLREDEDFLRREAERCKDCDLNTLHPAVRKRVIINLLEEQGLRVDGDVITRLESAPEGTVITLDKGYKAIVRNGRIKMIPPEEKPPEPRVIEKLGEFSFYGDKIVIITKEKDETKREFNNVNKKLTSCLADYDKIGESVVLRNRLRSDRIKPAGQPHTRELRKLLQERLPPEERTVSAVIEDGRGIVWAEHVGVDERVRPDESTRNVVRIEVKYRT